jgi:hypothetical protein
MLKADCSRLQLSAAYGRDVPTLQLEGRVVVSHHDFQQLQTDEQINRKRVQRGEWPRFGTDLNAQSA